MKKLIALAAATVLMLSSMGVTAFAGDGVTLIVNGKVVDFTGDQEPVIQNGRTLVPFRAAFEEMGAEVNWDNNTRLCEAVYGGTTVGITIDDTKVKLGDGTEIVSDVPAQIINGRTMVPLRILSESIGADVNWDNATRTVTVTTQDNNVGYTLELYTATAEGADGYSCLQASAFYPQFTGSGSFIASINTQLENSAKKAVDSFVESYKDEAIKAYNSTENNEYEVPYGFIQECNVEIVDNIATITNTFTSNKYDESLGEGTDIININLTTGEIVE